MFGTPDEVAGTTVEYLAMGVVSGVGWTPEGHTLAWTFDDAELHHFNSSPGWQLVASSVGADNPSDGGQRGLLAIDLLSQAIRHPRPAMRLLLWMIAAEALLLDRSPLVPYGSRAAGCTCTAARTRTTTAVVSETCPALYCDPGVPADRKKLRLFRERGDLDYRWRCSDWQHVLDWYDLRSRSPTAVSCRTRARREDTLLDSHQVAAGGTRVVRTTSRRPDRGSGVRHRRLTPVAGLGRPSKY